MSGAAAIPPRSRPGAVVRRRIERVEAGEGGVRRKQLRDSLAGEEPLEIRIRSSSGETVPVSVTMRTPGADFELAVGFLFGESLLADPAEVTAIRYCVEEAGREAQRYNVVTVDLAPGAAFSPAALRRNFYTTSSCGVCGKASMDAVIGNIPALVQRELRLPAGLLPALPLRLREAQSVFESTGGLHATGLFSGDGELLLVREDVGRHNGMDKVVGAAFLAGGIPLRQRVLLVSGRLSFELVQKAARAGAEVLAGVSAPSSLAVELAERCGITLVGFLRGSGFNVYTGAERIEG